MIEVHRFTDARPIQHAAAESAQLGIVGKPAQIAFEDAVIGDVEAHQRYEKPDIALGGMIGEQKRPALELPLDPVEAGKNIGKSLFIGDLRGGETGAVDAVVEIGIDAIVESIDLGASLRRVKIDRIFLPDHRSRCSAYAGYRRIHC